MIPPLCQPHLLVPPPCLFTKQPPEFPSGIIIQHARAYAPAVSPQPAIVSLGNVEWTSRAPRNAAEETHINREAAVLCSADGGGWKQLLRIHESADCSTDHGKRVLRVREKLRAALHGYLLTLVTVLEGDAPSESPKPQETPKETAKDRYIHRRSKVSRY